MVGIRNYFTQTIVKHVLENNVYLENIIIDTMICILSRSEIACIYFVLIVFMLHFVSFAHVVEIVMIISLYSFCWYIIESGLGPEACESPGK